MNEILVKIIPIFNQKSEWIGNISINLKTFEITDNLKNGYKIKEGE